MSAYDRHSIPAVILQQLRKHGLHPILHPVGSTATAVQAAQRLRVSLAEIANSIVWSHSQGMVMVVIGGNRRVSQAKLAAQVGQRVRLATSQEIERQLGLAIGALTPFVASNISLYIDQELTLHEIIYPAAGSDCSSVAINAHRLASITGAIICDLKED